MAYTIKQASEILGVTPRQVRRYIKEGKLQAKLVPGKYGQAYQIADIPADLVKQKPAEQPLDFTPTMAMDIINRLQEENRNLAGQLGIAQERARNLEGQVKLLAAPKKPWYRRLFRRSQP